MNFSGAKKYIIDRLKNELSLDYQYHSLEHTLDVHRSVIRLCRMEDLERHDQILVETAALYHDAGMINTYSGHEEASVKIIHDILPRFDYSIDEIGKISSMILSTKIPQSANTRLEKILCDADLDYLGRNDFFMIAEKLRYEWNLLCIQPTTLKEWYNLQVDFFENHNYYTHSAKVLRNDGKMQNLLQIKEVLNHK